MIGGGVDTYLLANKNICKVFCKYNCNICYACYSPEKENYAGFVRNTNCFPFFRQAENTMA